MVFSAHYLIYLSPLLTLLSPPPSAPYLYRVEMELIISILVDGSVNENKVWSNPTVRSFSLNKNSCSENLCCTPPLRCANEVSPSHTPTDPSTCMARARSGT